MKRLLAISALLLCTGCGPPMHFAVGGLPMTNIGGGGYSAAPAYVDPTPEPYAWEPREAESTPAFAMHRAPDIQVPRMPSPWDGVPAYDPYEDNDHQSWPWRNDQ